MASPPHVENLEAMVTRRFGIKKSISQAFSKVIALAHKGVVVHRQSIVVMGLAEKRGLVS